MQQHKSLILLSHTLVAAVRRPVRNWLDSWLSGRLGPAEECRAVFPPRGSKTMKMVTAVERTIIQLQNRQKTDDGLLRLQRVHLHSCGSSCQGEAAPPEPG